MARKLARFAVASLPLEAWCRSHRLGVSHERRGPRACARFLGDARARLGRKRIWVRILGLRARHRHAFGGQHAFRCARGDRLAHRGGRRAANASRNSTHTQSHRLTAHPPSKGVSPLNVVLYGKSLGSAAACYIASRRPIGGVILLSAIASGSRTVKLSDFGRAALRAVSHADRRTPNTGHARHEARPARACGRPARLQQPGPAEALQGARPARPRHRGPRCALLRRPRAAPLLGRAARALPSLDRGREPSRYRGLAGHSRTFMNEITPALRS